MEEESSRVGEDLPTEEQLLEDGVNDLSVQDTAEGELHEYDGDFQPTSESIEEEFDQSNNETDLGESNINTERQEDSVVSANLNANSTRSINEQPDVIGQSEVALETNFDGGDNDVVEGDNADEYPTVEETIMDPNFQQDITFTAEFKDRVDEVSRSYQEYLLAHPEIRTFLADYLHLLLHKKPKNVYEFTNNYFQ